jgi:hypothetical protein
MKTKIIIFIFSLFLAGSFAISAHAQTWRLTGPPEFMPSQNDGLVFQPGTSRKSYDKGELVTTTLNSRTANSAAFTTTHGLWGTGTITYSWDSPPEILRTGDVVAFNIRWNIGQKWRDWCPQMGSIVHLDWSADWYTEQWYGYSNHPVSPASGQERNTVIKVTSNDATELVFYVGVHSTPGDVRVQWKYRRVEGDATPSSGDVTTAPSYPNVVKTADGKFQPAPGYRWASDADGDMRVLWNPGARHPDYANVVAGAAEGRWSPAPGYRWASDAADDMRVVRKDAADRTTSGSTAETSQNDDETTIFSNNNIYGVSNGGTSPVFVLDRPAVITQIMNYHWNNGRGSRLGTIGLRDSSGRLLGTWAVTGSPGQGGVPNANWTATPNVKLPAGEYTVVDSDPATWSQNSQTDGKGMSVIKGRPTQ